MSEGSRVSSATTSVIEIPIIQYRSLVRKSANTESRFREGSHWQDIETSAITQKSGFLHDAFEYRELAFRLVEEIRRVKPEVKHRRFASRRPQATPGFRLENFWMDQPAQPVAPHQQHRAGQLYHSTRVRAGQHYRGCHRKDGVDQMRPPCQPRVRGSSHVPAVIRPAKHLEPGGGHEVEVGDHVPREHE